MEDTKLNEQGNPNAEPETATGGIKSPTPDTTKSGENTFTQDQVNEIVQERLSKVYKKFGVNNNDELDSYVKKGKDYDEVKKSYDSLFQENKTLKEEKIFRENKIEANKIDDVKTYFKGKEKELNDENLKEALSTHPEWVEQVTPTNFGASQSQKNPDDEEKAYASKIFGIDF